MSRAIITIIIIILLWYWFTKYDRIQTRMRARPQMSITRAIANMQPGDLIFGHWNYLRDGGTMKDHILFNRVYSAITGGSLTHVSIVVQAPNGKLYVYDNYPEPRRDAYFHTRKTGPVLMDPQEFFEGYGGDIIYYARQDSAGVDTASVWQYVEASRTKKYDFNFWRKISTLHKLTPNPDALKPVGRAFCAETTADILKIMFPSASALGHSSLVHPEDMRRFADRSPMYAEPRAITETKNP
jgi:hypothetical protein